MENGDTITITVMWSVYYSLDSSFRSAHHFLYLLFSSPSGYKNSIRIRWEVSTCRETLHNGIKMLQLVVFFATKNLWILPWRPPIKNLIRIISTNLEKIVLCTKGFHPKLGLIDLISCRYLFQEIWYTRLSVF